MIKKGFTLAEVLITLGIIGVIAALTMPNFINDSEKSKIGPKLAKAVAVFEQANSLLMQEYGVDLLFETGIFTGNNTTSIASTYAQKLSHHLKTTDMNDRGNEGFIMQTKDGFVFYIPKDITMPDIGADPAYKQILSKNFKIDINGESKPNKPGTDQFYFALKNDGSLTPKGSTNWDNTGASQWTIKCPKDKPPYDATYCAGHIFENNLKVLYK